LPFLEAIAGFADAVSAAGPACGGEPAGPPKLLIVMLAGQPLTALAGLTAILDTHDTRADAPPRIVFLAEVTDVERLYRALVAPLGLPARPPRLETPRAFKQDGMRGSLTLHTDAISGWIGRADARSLAALRAAPPGDAAFLRIAWTPEAATDGGASETRVTLDGDYLVLDYSATR
jgi:hypothetical protein